MLSSVSNSCQHEREERMKGGGGKDKRKGDARDCCDGKLFSLRHAAVSRAYLACSLADLGYRGLLWVRKHIESSLKMHVWV